VTQQTIGVGAASGDHTGDDGRTAFTKVNANFTELYASGTGRLLNFQVLTASGTFVPNAATAKLYVLVIGAGGGSRGPNSSESTPGGGGGAWCRKTYTSVVASYAYACGAAGVAGAQNVSGGNGGNTTFTPLAGTVLTAPGGKGSTTAVDWSIGAIAIGAGALGGAVATNGDINCAGECSASIITDTVTFDVLFTNPGANSPLGVGGLPVVALGANAGTGYGSGGGGGWGPSAGAAGRAGCVAVWEYS
jgi:hypothetical protein